MNDLEKFRLFELQSSALISCIGLHRAGVEPSDLIKKRALLFAKIINEVLDRNPSLCETKECECGHDDNCHENVWGFCNVVGCHCVKFSKKSLCEHSQEKVSPLPSADGLKTESNSGNVEDCEIPASTPDTSKSKADLIEDELNKDYEEKSE